VQGAPSFSNSFENSAGGLPSQSFSVRQTLSISAWQGVRVADRVADRASYSGHGFKSHQPATG